MIPLMPVVAARRRYLLFSTALKTAIEKAKREKIEKLEDAKSDIAWGNQIRSYVLHPYRMIKDVRTKVEIGDVDRVLDGDIDEFIKSSLLLRKSESKS
ncbi:unnamed protein product [marine sediment metagenome]|uniref:Prokaryotic-type class I peptide chain release factors domain-containing protein n=1 Tax=marine sediment metagenome TaxID=412755 RepID=X1INH3_9ZZZZ